MENIDIDIDIDRAALENIDIDKKILEKSISIWRFRKISISIKYRINWNLAYRTGLASDLVHNTQTGRPSCSGMWAISCGIML